MLWQIVEIVLLKRPLTSLKNKEVLYSQVKTILSVFCFVGGRLILLIGQISSGKILNLTTELQNHKMGKVGKGHSGLSGPSASISK